MSNAPFFCFWQELNELLDYGSSVLLFDGQVPLCYLLSLLVNLNLRCILPYELHGGLTLGLKRGYPVIQLELAPVLCPNSD